GPGPGGEFSGSRCMKALAEVHSSRPSELSPSVSRVVSAGCMWIGIAPMPLAFFSLPAMLSMENVTFVVPITALSYAAGSIAATLFLREHISRQRWVGVLIVCLGVTLVWLSRL